MSHNNCNMKLVVGSSIYESPPLMLRKTCPELRPLDDLPHCDNIRFRLLRLDKQKVAVQNSVDDLPDIKQEKTHRNFR